MFAQYKNYSHNCCRALGFVFHGTLVHIIFELNGMVASFGKPLIPNKKNRSHFFVISKIFSTQSNVLRFCYKNT